MRDIPVGVAILFLILGIVLVLSVAGMDWHTVALSAKLEQPERAPDMLASTAGTILMHWMALAVVTVTLIRIGMAISDRCSVADATVTLRADAVERGYAVWRVTDSGTGETVFEWTNAAAAEKEMDTP